MQSKVIAAFGYAANLVTAEPGETRTVQLDENGKVASGHYFYVQGRVVHSVQGTGEQLEDRVAGWLNTERRNPASTPNAVLDNSFPEGAQWLCIPHSFNLNGLPNVASLVLEDGAVEPLADGTNLLLVRGQLTVNGKTFTGPGQIRIRTGDTQATSQGTSYSLRFL
jgi:hypothetical protein